MTESMVVFGSVTFVRLSQEQTGAFSEKTGLGGVLAVYAGATAKDNETKRMAVSIKVVPGRYFESLIGTSLFNRKLVDVHAETWQSE